MAESGPATSTQTEEGKSRTVTVEKSENAEEPVLHLRLQQPKSDHKVKWTSDTVDNEFMGKKKSKCCCIYEKPKVFGESDSSSDDEEDDEGCTPHCRGHKKKCYRHHGHDHKDEHGHDHDHDGAHDGSTDRCDEACSTGVCCIIRNDNSADQLCILKE